MARALVAGGPVGLKQWIWCAVLLGGVLVPAISYASAPTATYAVSAVATATPPPVDGDAAAPIWKGGAHVELEHEFTYRKGIDGNTTDVFLLADAKYLYVAWVCRQTQPVIAQQLTNDSGTGGDDHVTLRLWPSGVNGVSYSFTVTPTGAHDESSTENTAFAPHWDSAARRITGGYDVTMRIPFDVIHAGANMDWSMQLSRRIAASGEQLIWSYNPAMSYAFDPLYAGQLTGIGKVARQPARPKPRLQVYGVAEAAAASRGGDTSRLGFDYSVPVSRTTSVFGTVHPDYSEVEYDQQSISPTEFQRFYKEVRPFFTQGANYYNGTGFTDLYTPSIPTPRYGYAVEGANNGLHYVAFNAVGTGRDENAQAVQCTSANQRFNAAYQRTDVIFPGLSDLTQSASLLYGNGKHFSAYTIFGVDQNSAAPPNAPNKNRNFGMELYDANSSVNLNLNSQDEFYSPLDGYVTVTDVHGYNFSVYKTWHFGANAKVQSIYISGYLDRNHNSAGALNQTDNSFYINIANRHNSGIWMSSSSSYLLIRGYGMVPFNQPNVGFWDNANPAVSFGGSAQAGHFLNGFEHYYSAYTNVKITKRVSIGLSQSQNVFTDAFYSGTQTLQNISWTYQFGPSGAFSLGVRQISGTPAGFMPAPAAKYTNLSFSLNKRFKDAHLYAVYGDPNALSTSPAFIVKLVRFVGADEGT